MGHVDIELNGRIFPIACEDGQEARLREVVTFVDSRLRNLASGNGHASDSQVYVLTMLTMADQLFDLRSDLAKMRTIAQAAARQSEQATAAAATGQPEENANASAEQETQSGKRRKGRRKGKKAYRDESAVYTDADKADSNSSDTAITADDPVDLQLVTKTVVVRELDPEVEERYARVIETLVERVDAVASRLARV